MSSASDVSKSQFRQFADNFHTLNFSDIHGKGNIKQEWFDSANSPTLKANLERLTDLYNRSHYQEDSDGVYRNRMTVIRRTFETAISQRVHEERAQDEAAAAASATPEQSAPEAAEASFDLFGSAAAADNVFSLFTQSPAPQQTEAQAKYTNYRQREDALRARNSAAVYKVEDLRAQLTNEKGEPGDIQNFKDRLEAIYNRIHVIMVPMYDEYNINKPAVENDLSSHLNRYEQGLNQLDPDLKALETEMGLYFVDFAELQQKPSRSSRAAQASSSRPSAAASLSTADTIFKRINPPETASEKNERYVSLFNELSLRNNALFRRAEAGLSRLESVASDDVTQGFYNHLVSLKVKEQFPLFTAKDMTDPEMEDFLNRKVDSIRGYMDRGEKAMTELEADMNRYFASRSSSSRSSRAAAQSSSSRSAQARPSRPAERRERAPEAVGPDGIRIKDKQEFLRALSGAVEPVARFAHTAGAVAIAASKKHIKDLKKQVSSSESESDSSDKKTKRKPVSAKASARRPASRKKKSESSSSSERKPVSRRPERKAQADRRNLEADLDTANAVVRAARAEQVKLGREIARKDPERFQTLSTAVNNEQAAKGRKADVSSAEEDVRPARASRAKPSDRAEEPRRAPAARAEARPSARAAAPASRSRPEGGQPMSAADKFRALQNQRRK